jgi:nucleotidyltransferase/DNA polymerase involved in DNA repair
MTLKQAQAVYADVAIIAADEQRVERAIAALRETLLTFTPLMEQEQQATQRKPKRLRIPHAERIQAVVFYLDMEALRGQDVRDGAEQIRRLLGERLQLSAHIGIASNKFVAFAVATTTESQTVAVVGRGQEQATVAPLSIDLLPLAVETYQRFTLLGLVTLGLVAGLPSRAVFSQFGRTGLVLHQLAQGVDHRPVVPLIPPKAEHALRYLDDALTNRLMLEAYLHLMSAELAGKLKKRWLMAQTVHLTLTLDTKIAKTRYVTPKRPVFDERSIDTVAASLLARFLPLATGVIGLELRVTALVPQSGYQLELFSYSGGQQERLEQTLQLLALRHRDATMYWIVATNPDAHLIEDRYTFERVRT